MKIKDTFLVGCVIAVFLGLAGESCNKDAQKTLTPEEYKKEDIEKKLAALTIALEANLKFREFGISCGYFRELKSKVIIIPLKKEVIHAAVEYKAALEGLSDEHKEQLLRKNYQELINASTSTFIFLIANNDLKNDEIVYFKTINDGLTLKTENGKEYKLKKFTQNFSTYLNPGWNRGYLHFDNFRNELKGVTRTYSVHFDGFTLACGDKTQTITAWAFEFEESEIDYLTLLEDGLKIDEIRDQYVETSYASIGINSAEILDIIKFIIKVLPK